MINRASLDGTKVSGRPAGRTRTRRDFPTISRDRSQRQGLPSHRRSVNISRYNIIRDVYRAMRIDFSLPSYRRGVEGVARWGLQWDFYSWSLSV